MVSEKLIIILIIFAILVSIVSVVITFSSFNAKLIPEVNSQNINNKVTPAKESGQVQIVIEKPPVVSGGLK